MSYFDFSNFERQGFIENDIHIETLEDIKAHLYLSTQNCLRNIRIFSPDLERVLYHDDHFRSLLLGFCRENRNTRVEILVDNLNDAIENGHAVLNLSQTLTSCITIKKCVDDFQNIGNAFILFDQKQFIYRPSSSSKTAILSSCKFRSDRLNEFFTLAWSSSEICEDSRRLIL